MLNIYANGIQAITLPVYPIYQCITFSHYQGSGHQHSTVTFGSRLPDDSVKRNTCRNCPGPLTYFVDIFDASIGIYRVTITDSHICTCTYIYNTYSALKKSVAGAPWRLDGLGSAGSAGAAHCLERRWIPSLDRLS